MSPQSQCQPSPVWVSSSTVSSLPRLLGQPGHNLSLPCLALPWWAACCGRRYLTLGQAEERRSITCTHVSMYVQYLAWIEQGG